MRFAVSAAVCALVVALEGCRTEPVQPAPVPPPPAAAVAAVHNAKKVFVLNGGMMYDFAGLYPYGQLVCYNEFYTALARTGRFQLVQDPADADLIASIEGVQEYKFDDRPAIPNFERYAIYDPAEVVLTLSQPGAKEPVYTMSALPPAAKKDPEKKLALAEAVSDLTNRLNAMHETAVPPAPAAPPASAAAPAQAAALVPADLIQATAPVPSKVLSAKRIFVMADPTFRLMSGADSVAPFTDALKASFRYTMLPSAQDADLVLLLSVNDGLRARILDGSTMNQIWTVDEPKGYYPGTVKKMTQTQAAATASVFLTLTKAP